MTKLNESTQIKKIKVGVTYTTPTKYINSKSIPVPFIRISGKYLQILGFNINDVFSITSSAKGILELKVIENSKPDLKSRLMAMFEASDIEADLLIRHANARVFDGDDPKTVLQEEFGLEPSYISDLLS